MLDSCKNNPNIKAYWWLGHLPDGNFTTAQMQTLDSVWTSVSAYAPTHVIDASLITGLFRSGGDVGNLWDIQTLYDQNDHVHYTRNGYEVYARGVVKEIKKKFSFIDTTTIQQIHTAITNQYYNASVTVSDSVNNFVGVDSVNVYWHRNSNSDSVFALAITKNTSYWSASFPFDNPQIGDIYHYYIVAKGYTKSSTTQSYSFTVLDLPDYRTNLAYMWRADTGIVAVAGIITTWATVTGCDSSMTLAVPGTTTGITPFLLNGSVHFQYKSWLTLPHQIVLSNYTICVVIKDTALNNAVSAWIGSNSLYAFTRYNNSTIGFGSCDAGGCLYATFTIDSGWTQKSYTNTQLWNNGTEATYGNHHTMTGLTINYIGLNGSAGFGGTITEIRIYNANLSDANRVIVQNKQKEVWGTP